MAPKNQLLAPVVCTQQQQHCEHTGIMHKTILVCLPPGLPAVGEPCAKGLQA